MSTAYDHTRPESTPAREFHDRDRNQIRTIAARADEATRSLVELGTALRTLRECAPQNENNTLAALDAFDAAFDALAAVQGISTAARSVLADHEVTP